MKKVFWLLILITIFLCFSVGQAFAETINIESLDKVVIKYNLTDGTTKEETIINKHNGKFEDSIKKLLEFYFDNYNIKEIVSINDTSLKNTQFSNYSGTISSSNKGAGYSNSKDVSQRAKDNSSSRLNISNTNSAKTMTAKLDDTIINFTVPPYTKNNLTYIQFRPLFEALGYNVTGEFNDYYQIVSATKKDNGENIRVDVKIGDKSAYKSKQGLITLEGAPEIKEGATCITIKSAEQLLNIDIKVDSKNKQLIITRK